MCNMEERLASERIRKAREKLGLSAEQVAEGLSLPVAWYHDLESDPDEVISNISLAHLQLLGGILGIDPRHILLGEKVSAPKERRNFQDVSTGLNRIMIQKGLDLDRLGEQVGWDICEVLIDSQELWNFTVDGLRDLCSATEIDWLAVLPSLP